MMDQVSGMRKHRSDCNCIVCRETVPLKWDTLDKPPNHDPVNRPAHYNIGKIEVCDFILDQQLGFCLGNVVKYVARADHKGKPLEDLKKAAWYLNREIARREALTLSTP